MPFALKNKESSELYSCTLVNIYDFSYHGVKLWEDQTAAAAEAPSFLVERGVDDPWLWEVVGLDENQSKLCNVKLNNNPAKRVFLSDEGKVTAK